MRNSIGRFFIIRLVGPCDKECRWHLGAESDFQLRARKKTGPQSYNHKERNSAKILTKLGSEFSLRGSRTECDLANTEVLSR